MNVTTTTPDLHWMRGYCHNDFQAVIRAFVIDGYAYEITTALSTQPETKGAELVSWLTIKSAQAADGSRTILHQSRHTTSQDAKTAAASWTGAPEDGSREGGTEHIQTAILAIATKRGSGVTIQAIRAAFGAAIARDRIDQALTDLFHSRQIKLIPEASGAVRRTLEDDALWLGGEYRHVILLPN